MRRCPSCDSLLPRDQERLGARCPKCCGALYEPPGRVSRPAREGEGACALHAGREAVGACGRCGNYFCEVCRTRWRDQILCIACVERILASRTATPEQTRAHFRQALLGLLMGLAAWLAFLLVALLGIGVEAVGNSAPANIFLVLLAFGVFVAALLLAVGGTGQAVAALRTRGPHMIMATSGLILSALFLGAFLGRCIFVLWVP